MFRFLLGLIIGLAGSFVGVYYWYSRRQYLHEEEDLIEIDQIPLPTE